ncbi:MAG TPA: hypothetical protein VGM47_01240 [Gammaproteobacteria bacterium]|jgi:hypothetical protein
MRIRFEVIRLLACVLVLGCAPAGGSADAPVPDAWKLAATTSSEPIRQLYIGKMTLISYANSKRQDASSAMFDVWGKAVYKKPQARGNLIFTTDIVEFKLDCAASTVTQLREVLQDSGNKILLDDKKAKAPRRVDFNHVSDLDSVPTDENVAFIATDFTCDSDLD